MVWDIRASNGNLIVLKWQNLHVISDLEYTAIYRKTWRSSLLYIQQRRVQNPFKCLSKEVYLFGGSCFRKRCLTRFWTRYFPMNHKSNQSTWGKDTQHGNFKGRYISVLNHWKTFETTLTTEWNERNQITYLQS